MVIIRGNRSVSSFQCVYYASWTPTNVVTTRFGYLTRSSDDCGHCRIQEMSRPSGSFRADGLGEAECRDHGRRRRSAKSDIVRLHRGAGLALMRWYRWDAVALSTSLRCLWSIFAVAANRTAPCTASGSDSFYRPSKPHCRSAASRKSVMFSWSVI